jgi:hypothetical protein
MALREKIRAYRGIRNDFTDNIMSGLIAQFKLVLDRELNIIFSIV